MANIANLVNVGDGEVKRIMVRKEGQGSMTVTQRAERVAAAARLNYGATHVAVRLRRKWTIWDARTLQPIMQDLTEDAAVMWLQYRGR